MMYLCVTMPDGSRWDCPASLVARHRAMHYAEGDEDSRMFRKVYNETLQSDNLLRGWLEMIPKEWLKTRLCGNDQ